MSSSPVKTSASINPFGGGKRAEAEVLRRRAAGQSISRIESETGIHPTIVRRAYNQNANDDARIKARLRQGSRDLRDACIAEAAARENRFKCARKLSGTVSFDLRRLR